MTYIRSGYCDYQRWQGKTLQQRERERGVNARDSFLDSLASEVELNLVTT